MSLFQTAKQNVGQHLKGIFAEGELVQDSVVKDSFTTAADGKGTQTNRACHLLLCDDIFKFQTNSLN